MTFLASYPLTRQDLKGRKIIQYMIFFTMLFNGGVIPTFLVVRALGMVDSLWALIIPGAVSAYNIFVLRNFIQGIPESLMEAARIEGAGEFYILMRIIVPLSTPVIAVLGLLYGVGHWNSWFSCIIYINSTQHYVLQALLRQILFSMGSNNYFGYDPDLAAASMPVIVQMCVVVIATAPILCLYPFLQGYFVKGVTLGAVKG
jgi:putative aldouronate transport system permease protein